MMERNRDQRDTYRGDDKWHGKAKIKNTGARHVRDPAVFISPSKMPDVLFRVPWRSAVCTFVLFRSLPFLVLSRKKLQANSKTKK